jgi:hypothetical protein
MMAKPSNHNPCVICGIPLDAECFDVSGFVGKAFRDEDPADPFGKITGLKQIEELPRRGEQKVLAGFQLHPQYCGVLTYFAQFTDLHARDNSQIQTPGFEWLILQNGKPLFPYTRLELIVNPWGANCLPILVRLDENARIEFVLRNRSVNDDDLNDSDGEAANYPIRVFAGRILGRYWYNESFGGRNSR